MEAIYSGVVSLAVAMLAFILQSVMRENHRLKKEKEQDSTKRERALEKGVRSLLRSELVKSYNSFMHKGSVTLGEYAEWSEMYGAYEGLGGNGPVKHMNDVVEDLKMKSGGDR